MTFLRLLHLFLILLLLPVSLAAQDGRFVFGGSVTSVQPLPSGAEIELNTHKVRVEYIDAVGFRIRHSWSGSFAEPHSYAVVHAPVANSGVQVKDEPQVVTITAGNDVLHIQKNPFRVAFQDKAGHQWFRESFGPGNAGGRSAHVLLKQEGEQFFGLGDKAAELNRTGRAFTLWNADVSSFLFNEDPLDKSFPFFYGMREGKAWGIFYDNPARTEIDFGARLKGHISYSADSGELRYYLFSGPNLSAIVQKYTQLTGRAAMPPLWALGFRQTAVSDMSERDLYESADAFRDRKFPLDAIMIGADYIEDGRAFSWDSERFPNAAAANDEMLKRGIRTVPALIPGIKDDNAFELRNTAANQGVFVQLPDGSSFSGEDKGGRRLFTDFSNPAARTWWGGLHQQVLNANASGVAVAGNFNPMSRGENFPAFAQFSAEGKGAGYAQMHNVYGLLMARSSFEGLMSLRPDVRPFVQAESAYSGIQRYASVWTGDRNTDWDGMSLRLPMIMSLGLAGVPLAGFDVAASGEQAPELFSRALQLATLMPMMGTPASEEHARNPLWAGGSEYEGINRHFMEMRYRMLPLLYSAMYQHTKTGAPLVRPMLWNWQNDPHVIQIDDQFLVGDHVVVAPVMKAGVNERSVYLPEGLWYHYHSREKVQGGKRFVVPAPARPSAANPLAALRAMPVFARAGAVIAEREPMEHVGQKPVKEMELQIFAGGNQTSVVYEDDGLTNAYKRGAYRALTFTTEAYRGGFKITVQQEGTYTEGAARYTYMIHGLDRKPDRITIGGRNIVYFYERSTNTIIFKIAAGPNDIHVIYQ